MSSEAEIKTLIESSKIGKKRRENNWPLGAENTMKSIYSKLMLKSEYKEKSKRIEKIIVKIHIDEFNCDKNLVNSNRVSSLEKNH